MSRKKYPPLPITAEQRAILQNAPNVYLIGLMGAGKSTVGRILAQALQRDFVDSDDEIIARTGTTIGTIFEIEGEAGFREREARVIADLTKRHDLVLATGGGAVLREANRDLLRERTKVIYLRVQPDELFRRLRHDTQRPLLQVDDPKTKLVDLFEQRDPFYQVAAHFVIETSRPRIPTMVTMIMSQLELAGLLPMETPTA
jgi:shikimate kinase